MFLEIFLGLCFLLIPEKEETTFAKEPSIQCKPPILGEKQKKINHYKKKTKQQSTYTKVGGIHASTMWKSGKKSKKKECSIAWSVCNKTKTKTIKPVWDCILGSQSAVKQKQK